MRRALIRRIVKSVRIFQADRAIIIGIIELKPALERLPYTRANKVTHARDPFTLLAAAAYKYTLFLARRAALVTRRAYTYICYPRVNNRRMHVCLRLSPDTGKRGGKTDPATIDGRASA